MPTYANIIYLIIPYHIPYCTLMIQLWQAKDGVASPDSSGQSGHPPETVIQNFLSEQVLIHEHANSVKLMFWHVWNVLSHPDQGGSRNAETSEKGKDTEDQEVQPATNVFVQTKLSKIYLWDFVGMVNICQHDSTRNLMQSLSNSTTCTTTMYNIGFEMFGMFWVALIRVDLQMQRQVRQAWRKEPRRCNEHQRTLCRHVDISTKLWKLFQYQHKYAKNQQWYTILYNITIINTPKNSSEDIREGIAMHCLDLPCNFISCDTLWHLVSGTCVGQRVWWCETQGLGPPSHNEWAVMSCTASYSIVELFLCEMMWDGTWWHHMAPYVEI